MICQEINKQRETSAECYERNMNEIFTSMITLREHFEQTMISSAEADWNHVASTAHTSEKLDEIMELLGLKISA